MRPIMVTWRDYASETDLQGFLIEFVVIDGVPYGIVLRDGTFGAVPASDLKTDVFGWIK